MFRMFGKVIPSALLAATIALAPVAAASPDATADNTNTTPTPPTAATPTTIVPTVTMENIETMMVHIDGEISGFVTYVDEDGKTVVTDKPVKLDIEGLCTGTFIASGVILTAAHCDSDEGNAAMIIDKFINPEYYLTDEELDAMTDEELEEMQDAPDPVVTGVSGTDPLSGMMVPNSAPDIKLTVRQRAYMDGKTLNDGPVKAVILGSIPIEKGDVSLLQIPLKTPFVPIAAHDPKFDTTVYAVGYPGSVDYGIAEGDPMQTVTVTKGVMGNPQPYDAGKPGNHVGATFDFGMSGGGIFTVVNGQPVLAGVISNMISDKFYYASTVEQIRRLLASENIAFETVPKPVTTTVKPTSDSKPEAQTIVYKQTNVGQIAWAAVVGIAIIAGLIYLIVRMILRSGRMDNEVTEGQAESAPELVESTEAEVDQLNQQDEEILQSQS